MSVQGIVLIDILGIGFLLLTLNLIRLQKLHVGYGVLWTLAVCALMAIVSVPALLGLVTRAVGAIFPASAVSLLAFVFIFVVLIGFSVQLSIMSARQVELIQSLALRELLAEEDRAARERDPVGEQGRGLPHQHPLQEPAGSSARDAASTASGD